MTTARHRIEVFTAGCPVCEEALRMLREIASPEEITMRDMRGDKHAQKRARELGIHRVPTAVVNGNVAQCCASGAIDPTVIRSLLR
jgi:hypothetical protein